MVVDAVSHIIAPTNKRLHFDDTNDLAAVDLGECMTVATKKRFDFDDTNDPAAVGLGGCMTVATKKG